MSTHRWLGPPESSSCRWHDFEDCFLLIDRHFLPMECGGCYLPWTFIVSFDDWFLSLLLVFAPCSERHIFIGNWIALVRVLLEYYLESGGAMLHLCGSAVFSVHWLVAGFLLKLKFANVVYILWNEILSARVKIFIFFLRPIFTRYFFVLTLHTSH